MPSKTLKKTPAAEKKNPLLDPAGGFELHLLLQLHILLQLSPQLQQQHPGGLKLTLQLLLQFQ